MRQRLANPRRPFAPAWVAAHLLALLVGGGAALDAAPQTPTAARTYIVQAESVREARAAVEQVGATTSRELKIINAVGAALTDDQRRRLQDHNPSLRVYEDGEVRAQGLALETHYPTLIGASELHRRGVDGRGVTVAVIDTGLWLNDATRYDARARRRILAQHDALAAQQRSRDDDDDDDDDREVADIDDPNGHGTHVTAVITSSRLANTGRYEGVAPSAQLVAVRAFDERGAARYIDVIGALDWVLENRSRYDIRVLNLSFSAEPRSSYWQDPLNQAVMQAWYNGIVVVAAAGNRGPRAMSIGVPGNLPYVVTVGAMTDSYTPADPTDDLLASFSSAGPTQDGFIKPDIVAPGGHMLAGTSPHGRLARTYPQYLVSGEYFSMSGTSQAAAVVSGVAALMLQVNRDLTPDEVKCRLIAYARPALRATGEPAYSIFQQGAGLVDALGAVYGSPPACASRRRQLALDIVGFRHYVGPAERDANGNYWVVDVRNGTRVGRLEGDYYFWRDGYLWRTGPASTLWSDGYLWRSTHVWQEGHLWSDSYLWRTSYLWRAGELPAGQHIWSAGLDEPVSTNLWVTPE